MVKILCLHGYLQSGAIVQSKFTKLLGKRFELICPDAPFSVEIDDKSGFGWWTIPVKFNLTQSPTEDQIEICLAYGRELIEKYGQPEYVIGFSQGASCATLWLQHGIIKPKKVILMSNFALQTYLNGIQEVPALHVVGERDELLQAIIPESPQIQESKLSLWQYYSNSEIYIHRWGHVIPSDSKSRDKFLSFLT